jgi:ABC-2 family transporter protein
MTWLAWRQFRIQAIVAAAIAAVLAGFFLYTGPQLARLYDASSLAGCHASDGCPALVSRFFSEVKLDSANPVLFFLGSGALILLPAVLGAFWGAPLVTSELESGSFKLTWNQGVTRTRWMIVKLALTGLAAMATAGVISLVFTWWVSPVDKAGGFPDNLGQWSRLSPLMFADRGIAPVGWAAFAFVLGVTVGVVVRRTIPAMAITLAVVVAVQILWPGMVRSHLIVPQRATAAVAVRALGDALITHGGELIMPTSQPGLAVSLSGAWVVSNKTITTTGHVFVLPLVAACENSSLTAPGCDRWFASQHLRQVVSYVPASSFWPLQWFETAILLILATGLGGLCMGRVRRLMT